MPLDPEVAREAEVDWGTAWVLMAGRRRQVKLFVMRSRYSAKPFVRAYPWERQEMFFDGHMHAFHYYGGVFRELIYDNLTQSVKRILRGKKRLEQERFVSFRNHYTYRARYCTPGQGQEKGGVEGLIGFARRNFLVPLPRVRDFEELNHLLAQRCEQYGTHQIGGREGFPYGGRTLRSRTHFLIGSTRSTLRELQAGPGQGGFLSDRPSGSQSILGASSARRLLALGPRIGRLPNTIESSGKASGRSIRCTTWI